MVSFGARRGRRLLGFVRSLTQEATPAVIQPAPQPEGDRFERATALLDGYLRDVESHVGYPRIFIAEQFPHGKAALEAPTDVQAALIVVAVARLLPAIDATSERRPVYELRALLAALFQRRPSLGWDDIDALLDLLAGSPATWSTWAMVRPLATAIERQAKRHAPEPPPETTLARIRRLRETVAGRHLYADERKGLDLLAKLLPEEMTGRALIDPSDDWGAAAVEALAVLDSAADAGWLDVLAYAAGAKAPAPTGPWLKGAKKAIAGLGADRFAEIAAEWLLLMRRPASGRTRSQDGFTVPAAFLTDRNATLLKGLAWMCAASPEPALAAALGDAALGCMTKIPEVGARSLKAGNACVKALAAMPGMDAVAQLVRLQQRITHRQTHGMIEQALQEAARRAGMTEDALTDLAVPTFDLVDGRVRRSVGAYTAEIAIAPAGKTELRWLDADGTPRKGVPAAIRREHADELKALKRIAADIQAMLAAQRLRLERVYLADRDWLYPAWRERVLDHPLLAFLARRLIWSFTSAEETRFGCWLNGRLVGLDDAPLAEPGPDDRVRLFHPVKADAATTLAWQLWLERHRVTQPFKQAHREIYPLTDAERTTETYSLRYGGHILHQHQFAALCKQRGWEYRLQGAFDGGNLPSLPLRAGGLRANLVADYDPDDDELNRAGIGRFVTTGRVWFTRGYGYRADTVRLDAVPPILFSEAMRDIDLFVGVCGIGADPAWQDRPDRELGRFAAYVHDRSSDELNQAAQGRRDLLVRLLPSLAIGARCTLDDRYLIVRGDLRTYKIHLGSGNILMEPNNAYLCIVQQRTGEGKHASEPIYLPFEGDATLSLILSKAMLLARDTAITDPTILRQIKR